MFVNSRHVCHQSQSAVSLTALTTGLLMRDSLWGQEELQLLQWQSESSTPWQRNQWTLTPYCFEILCSSFISWRISHYELQFSPSGSVLSGEVLEHIVVKWSVLNVWVRYCVAWQRSTRKKLFTIHSNTYMNSRSHETSLMLGEIKENTTERHQYWNQT